MIGNHYWTTGIEVRHDGRLWMVNLKFYDSGFCQNDATEGELHVRYRIEDVAQAVRVLKADADRLGIAFKITDEIRANLYACETEDCPLPANWRDILQPVADEVGLRLTEN